MGDDFVQNRDSEKSFDRAPIRCLSSQMIMVVSESTDACQNVFQAFLVNLVPVNWILTGPPYAGHAGASLLCDLPPGKALSMKCACLIAAEYCSGSTDRLDTARPMLPRILQAGYHLSRITLHSNSAMAAMMVNMAFPIGVLVSSASWWDTKSMPS